MATYKVLQDIEAEDKLVGPLTLRQFIYAGIAAFSGYLTFILIVKQFWYISIPFWPVIGVSGFFAFPWGRDQPTEIWALAKIRFLFKPRRRIWDQSGVKELVTINVPKKVDLQYTNGLSQTEVRSRLHTLADTIDSRGWAIKNVNVNLYAQQAALVNTPSDRLIDISNIPQEVPTYDISASDDMLDEANSPVAQHFSEMIATSVNNRRERIMQKLRSPAPAPTPQPQAQQTQATDFWFLNGQTPAANYPNGYTTFQNSQVVMPASDAPADPMPQPSATPDEEAIIAELEEREQKVDTASHSHIKTIQPLHDNQHVHHAAPPAQSPAPVQPTPQNTPAQTNASPQTPDAAILELARNNDLNVATIAREAKRTQEPGDEVVISLR